MFQCVPLAFGLVGPGIYIRPTKGRAYFFRTRNTEELINVLGGWRGSSVSSALVKKKPIARDPFEAAEHTADWIASLAPDTLPEIEEPPASIASLLLGSLAEDEEPPVPITSIAPDPTDSDENS